MQNGNTNRHGRLDGRVALITGAGRGLGAGIALEFGSQGASVAANYRKSATAAEEVAADLLALGTRAVATQAESSNPAKIDALFEQTTAHFGRVDIGIESRRWYFLSLTKQPLLIIKEREHI